MVLNIAEDEVEDGYYIVFHDKYRGTIEYPSQPENYKSGGCTIRALLRNASETRRGGKQQQKRQLEVEEKQDHKIFINSTIDKLN